MFRQVPNLLLDIVRQNSFIIIVTLVAALSTPFWYQVLELHRGQTLSILAVLGLLLGLLNGYTGVLDMREKSDNTGWCSYIVTALIILVTAYCGAWVLRIVSLMIQRLSV